MELREKIAREIEPQAWAALGTGDTLAYKNRRTGSARKADRILAITEIADALAASLTLPPGVVRMPGPVELRDVRIEGKPQ